MVIFQKKTCIVTYKINLHNETQSVDWELDIVQAIKQTIIKISKHYLVKILYFHIYVNLRRKFLN